MKKILILFITIFITMISTPCFAGANFIFDLKPGSILFSPDIDGFRVSRTSGSDTVSGSGSWMPTLKAGMRIDNPALNIDLTGGFGFLVNGAFHSYMYLADLALRFKISKHATVGPHVSVIKFDPKKSRLYGQEINVNLSEETAFMPGLCFTVGGKTASFSASIDYINTSFDVTTYNGWVSNYDSLDIAGFAIQLGVLFVF